MGNARRQQSECRLLLLLHEQRLRLLQLGVRSVNALLQQGLILAELVVEFRQPVRSAASAT